MSDTPSQPPGWYYAQGDPPGTQRYWDGANWQGGPQPVPGSEGAVGVGAVGGEMQTAEPLLRIGGRLIDGVLWFIVGTVIQIVIIGSTAFTGDFGDIGFGRVALAGLLQTALVAAYEIFMVGNQGATLGKMAVSTKVVKEDGSPADMETAVRRMLLYIGVGILSILPVLGVVGSIIFFLVAIAGLVMLFTDERKQTPWDKIGKTLVVPRG